MVILNLTGRIRLNTYPSGSLIELGSSSILVWSEYARSFRSFVIQVIKYRSFRNLGKGSVDFGPSHLFQRLLQAEGKQEHTFAPRAINSISYETRRMWKWNRVICGSRRV